MSERLPSLAALALPMLLWSCAAREPAESIYEVVFSAVDDRGAPVSEVAVLLDGSELGSTGTDGRLAATLRGRDGESAVLGAKCPPGHATAELPQRFRFARTRSLGDSPEALEIGVLCARSERLAVLLVRTPRRAGIPIVVDGRSAGFTNEHGLDHVRLDLAPGASLQVTLDTHALPGLVPANPSRMFTIGEEDSLLVFDQSFEDPPTKVRRRKRVKQEQPAKPRRPIRID